MKMQTARFLILSAFVLAMIIPSTIAHATGILYVIPDGSGDCSNWINACSLQTALTMAFSGDEIWVTAGIYKPTIVETDRYATFQLKNDVALYGGFTGSETMHAQRNLVANVTILSGDIDNNDDQTPLITDLSTETHNTQNSCHVVIGATGAILDGFTITAGYANKDICLDTGCGGGMFNYSSSPTLENIIFIGNSSNSSYGGQGGGMYNYNSSPTLTNVTFSFNFAMYGGGMDNYSNSNPTLRNVTFNGNTGQDGGGGIFNTNSNPTLTNVTLSGNMTDVDGGGIFSQYGSGLMMTNVTISGNKASDSGGGMFNFNTNPQISNTIFWGNTASNGGIRFLMLKVLLPR